MAGLPNAQLTSASIDAILEQHDRDQTLKRFVPLTDPDESSDARDFLMVPRLHEWLYQSDRKKTADFKANIRAFLKRYVAGGHIDNSDYMKSWTPHVFEFRVQLQPLRENTRIFGAFVKRDIFVAIHQKLRSEFGGKDDPKWKAATDRAFDEVAAMFPGCQLVRSAPFAGCISDNFTDVNFS